MPRRTRSHELEEQSINRFREVLPAKWVYRVKAPDYGIDGEVEIFDAEGQSTGLIFLVQLRATDNAARADRVSLETDELDYYEKFDVPVAVIRYGAAADGFHWQWATIISSKVDIAHDQKSVTYRFEADERWIDATPAAIQRTLEVRRVLATFPASKAVPLRLDFGALAPSDHYAVERAFAQAIAASRGALSRAAGDQLPFEIDLVTRPDGIDIRIDQLASGRVDIVAPTIEDHVTAALYGLTRLLREQRLSTQAEGVARLLLTRGLRSKNEELAISACQALTRDLSALVDLAKLNGLHRPTNMGNALISMIIARTQHDPEGKRTAMDAFYAAMLAEMGEEDADGRAAAHYSIGNHYRGQGFDSRAVLHYNNARRYRPAYLRTGYFLRELAGTLYEAGRLTAAACLYGEAASLQDDEVLTFLRGDALMMTGKVGEAEACFREAAVRCTSLAMVVEAELKADLCAWLAAQVGENEVPRARAAANALLGAGGSSVSDQPEAILRDVDALNPLARFNRGIGLERDGDKREALSNFLICAFVQPHDLSAWANAAICALALNDALLLIRIMTVAIQRNDAEAYDHLRPQLVAQHAAPDFLAALDRAILDILEEKAKDPEAGFTLRMLDGDSYQSMTIVGGDP